jgi:glycosyltransferase involved in cell wall biosynthesis
MAGNAPDISIVVCTYNGARYLREQLDSLLRQTLPAREIIIQDDGSRDGTLLILKEYARLHPQIKIYQNPGPHGINPNFFSAMRRAACPLIALSDQDDIWEPRKLELQAAAIGDKLLCSGISEPFSDDGYPVSSDHRQPNYHALRVAYIGALPGHTFLMRRELLGYLPDGDRCPYLYDWQLQLVASVAESIAYVPQTLVHFRRHAGAATAYKPVGRHVVSRSGLQYLKVILLHHHTLQREVRRRFLVIRDLLQTLPFRTSSMTDCLTMTRLQIARGPVAMLRRMAFFVGHRENIFYAREPRNLTTALKAACYPFACGYYYRKVLHKE